MNPLCIYHGNCADGFGAAWVVWKRFNGCVEFFPGVYQRPPPVVRGRDVIMVDFSYKLPVLNQMLDEVNSLLVLDHHKTALEDLAGWPTVKDYDDWLGMLDAPPDNFACLFDMERSGAGITWDFFYPGQPRPALLDHIEDRDLWRFKLPYTREIQAAMFSLPYEFALWNERIEDFPRTEFREILIAEGAAIERKHHKDIAELIEVVTRPMKFQVPYDGPDVRGVAFTTVPAANLPYTLTSDAGHLLCGRDFLGGDPGGPHPFAACYWDKPDGRQFSLRSREGGADVGAIAKIYGGGGHKNASGFLVPYNRLHEFEP